MKKLFLLTLPLVALSFNACSKDGDNGNGTGSGKLIKTVDWDNGDSVYEFTYDSQERLSKIVIEYDNKRDEVHYTYLDNHIIADWGSGDIIRTLDADGYLIKKEWERSDGYSSFSYSNGYLTQRTSSTSNEIVTYTWDDGNLIRRDHNAADERDTTFTYNDVENKLNLSIFEVLGSNPFEAGEHIKFKGASPKNYPISESYESSYYGGNSRLFSSMTYEYDADGYPTEIICFYPEDNKTSTIAITYY